MTWRLEKGRTGTCWTGEASTLSPRFHLREKPVAVSEYLKRENAPTARKENGTSWILVPPASNDHRESATHGYPGSKHGGSGSVPEVCVVRFRTFGGIRRHVFDCVAKF